METNFKLGEQVVVVGRYVETVVTRQEVAEMKCMIESGGFVISNKYDRVYFDKARKGVIVGKRTISTKRKHFQSDFFGDKTILTKPTRWETVYLIACDMRGLIYVSEEELCDYELLGEIRFWAESQGLGADYLDNVCNG